MIIKIILLATVIFLHVNAWAESQPNKSNDPIVFGLKDKENGLLGLEFTPPEGNDWIIKRSGAEVSVKKMEHLLKKIQK